MNNSSFFTADRTTHLKIVVVSLLASIAVLVVGIGVAGFAYYQHKQNTLLEVNVGQHGVTIQKN